MRADVHGSFKDSMCENCRRIPSLRSFVKRLQRSEQESRDIRKIRNDYLTKSEVTDKLRKQERQLEQKESQIFFPRTQNVWLKINAKSLKEQLKEYSLQGSGKSIVHRLNSALQKGLLNDKTVLRDMLDTVSRNLHVKKNRKRYEASVKMFLNVVLIWGGP